MSTEKEKALFEDLTKTAKEFAPNFKVVSKKNHWLHKTIGWFLKAFKINQSYMTDYWTTLGSTTAYPLEETEGEHYRSWKTIPHEGLHAIQAKKVSNFLFGALYLLGTPVYLLLLLFCWPFFIWLPWWSGVIYIAITLFLSSPVPCAYFRYRWEKEAYALSIAIEYWVHGKVDDRVLDNMTAQFITSQYFWMWPYGKKSMRKRLEAAKEKAISGEMLEDKYYAAIVETLKKYNRYAAPA